jgi:Helix-turn-helix domain
MKEAPEKKFQKPSHSLLILRHLEAGHTLTPLQALNLFGCLSLSQRITDLRKQGHKIHTQMITLQSGKRVAKYALEQ